MVNSSIGMVIFSIGVSIFDIGVSFRGTRLPSDGTQNNSTILISNNESLKNQIQNKFISVLI